MTNNPETSDPNTPPAVERYFAVHPDIFDVELTEGNTVPRRPR
ncbi:MULTISPECIES: hypothetical protein [unclassified Corynebacterium]